MADTLKFRGLSTVEIDSESVAEREIVIDIELNQLAIGGLGDTYSFYNSTQVDSLINDLVAGVGASILDELEDVSLAGLSSGQILSYNGTSWVNTSSPPANISSSLFQDLSNVNFTSLASGEYLSYNGTDWVNVPAPVGGVTSVNGSTGAVTLNADSIDDAFTTHKFATAAQLAKADNAASATGSISQFVDVEISSIPSDGDALIYSNNAFRQTAITSSQWDDVTGGINYADGNVGIGTTSPSELLDVRGASDPQLKVSATNTGTNSAGLFIENQGQRNWQIWVDRPSDQLRIGNNSRATTNLAINSAGNVGIGLTTPFTTLSVFKNIAGGNPQTSGSTDSNVFTRLQGGSVGLDFGGTTPGLQWIQPRLISDFSANFGLSLCPNGGNVGIGTTAPAEKLFVTGNIGLSGNSPTKIFTNANSLYLGADEDGGNSNSNITFNVDASERARIDSAGRLLVGTSSSLNNFVQGGLQVQGTGANSYITATRFSSAATSPAGLILGRSKSATLGTNTTVASGDRLGDIWFTGADGTGYIPAAFIRGEVDGTPGTNDMPGRLVFSVTADGASSPTERMRINSSGEIGFGLTPSAARVHIKGAGTSSSASAIIALDGSDAELFKVRNDGAIFTGNTTNSPYNLTTATAANCVINTDYTLRRSTSSIKYKTAVEDVKQTYSDAVVFGARPVWYRSLCEGDNSEWSYYGLIAEEIAEIDPRFVFWGEPDAETGVPEAEGVQYDRLTVMLIDVVQRQQKTIEALEVRVAALQEALAKIETLEQRLSDAGL